MQFIDRYTGPGTNKVVTVLRGPVVLDYLCLQILDILHDSDIEQVTNQRAINLLIGMIAHWICVKNELVNVPAVVNRAGQRINITDTVEGKLCDAIAKQMRELTLLSGSARGQQYDAPNVYNIANYVIRQHSREGVQVSARDPELDRFMVDACGQSRGRSVIGCDASRAILTWSVLYDNGSSQVYCGDPMRRAVIMMPCPTLINIQRATGMSDLARDKLCVFNSAVCANHFMSPSLRGLDERGQHNGSNIYDMEVVTNLYDLIGVTGAIPDRLVVLSERNFVLGALGMANIIGGFSFDAGRNEYAILAHSPPAPEIKRVFARLANQFSTVSSSLHPMQYVTRENEQHLLYTYVLMLAKHWGDLGLILDSLSRNASLFTQDHMARAIAALLGVTTISSGMIARSARMADVLTIFERNTAEMRGRGPIYGE